LNRNKDLGYIVQGKFSVNGERGLINLCVFIAKLARKYTFLIYTCQDLETLQSHSLYFKKVLLRFLKSYFEMDA